MNKTLLCVYGTLKAGYINSIYLSNSNYLGEFWTPKEYAMYNIGQYPAVVKVDKKDERARHILTEVYEVDDIILADIKILEGFHGVRGAKENYYDMQQIQTPFGIAEIFLYNREPFNKTLIFSGVFEK